MKHIPALLLLALACFYAPTGTAQGTAPKEVIAIYHFTTARDYSYDYAIGVGNAVEAGVLRSGRFTVVERSRFGSIADEERFKEANTSDIVRKASKLGAKAIITGHVVGVSRGDIVSSGGERSGKEYVEMSLSFKITDVASSEIRKSEIVSGRGEGKNYTEAAQNAYISVDKIIRAHVAAYLPQRFKFMSVVSTGTKKETEYLDKFKIWAGSDDGLKPSDIIDIYKVTMLTNPNTGKKVEEKTLLAQAKVNEVNGGSSSTCQLIDAKRKGAPLLAEINGNPTGIAFEFQGNWYQQVRLIDLLSK